jgi:Tol biopolymer transport system component
MFFSQQPLLFLDHPRWKDKSYDPHWNPDSKKIVYYLEKGDGHDQISMTDINGSFHTNLTSDTTTHNFFPSWLDDQTVLYTQSPDTIILMNVNDRKKKKVEGINSEQVKYNIATGTFVYVTTETDNYVVLHDWKTKTKTIIVDGTKILDRF